MKHLKLFENWLRRSDDKELIEVADYIDDITLDIIDMDFPYCYPAMINDRQGSINFEVGATSDNSLTQYDKFELTTEIFSIIERCYQYIESIGYKMEIYARWDIIENATLGEYVEDIDGGGVLTLDELKGYIGKELHFIGVTIKK